MSDHPSCVGDFFDYDRPIECPDCGQEFDVEEVEDNYGLCPNCDANLSETAPDGSIFYRGAESDPDPDPEMTEHFARQGYTPHGDRDEMPF